MSLEERNRINTDYTKAKRRLALDVFIWRSHTRRACLLSLEEFLHVLLATLEYLAIFSSAYLVSLLVEFAEWAKEEQSD